MPKTKDGEKISWKEFMKRWKKGIEGITPLQQIKSQMGGMRVMMFGMAAGLFICFLDLKRLWWLGLILGGGLFNTYIQYIGLKQKKDLFDSFSDTGKKEVKNDTKK